MSKELRALLKEINDKKNAIKSLVAAKKTNEAKQAKEELVDMQARFDILMSLEDEEEEEIKDSVENGTAKHVGGQKKPTKKDIARAFVNRIVCGLTRRKLTQEDAEIMDKMSEGTDEDGGFTVPQDIQTDIIELRRTQDDLEQFVTIEPVTTEKGSRIVETDAESTPWPDVDEGAEFTEEETPKLKQVKYEIKKKGGILKTTRELLMDTATNILAFINKWIAKKSRATRNAAILKKLKEITADDVKAISSIDDLKNVFDVELDTAIAASSMVITNQLGFNWLNKLKNKDGNYIVQPDVTDKTKKLLFGEYPIHVVSKKVLKSVTSGNTIKHPVYMGDPKEAITLYDREKITIELSTEAGDLWAKDLTGIKVRDRFDVQAIDEEAVVAGEITETVAG